MGGKPNRCDECGRERRTLYQVPRALLCYYCLPVECLSGVRASRLLRRSVTGLVNIEQRRRSLKSKK
jgi:hypothetical protein